LAKFLYGIQGKTAFIFIGVFVIIILPVNYLIYSNVKRLLIVADTRELKAEGEKLFSQVKLDPPVFPLPPLGYSIYLQAGNDIRIDSVFASPNFPVEFVALSRQSMVEIDTFKIVTLTRQHEYGNGQIIFSVGKSNRQLLGQISELKMYLFTANGISILLAGLLVYFVSGYTLRPIKKIIQVAQRINASKSIDRVPVPASADENRELALTINEMLTRIEHSIVNQTNFFASAAHELRTPLAVMKAELTLVKDEKRWHSMLKELERLERTVNDFLMISELKSESLAIRKKKIELDELLFSALKKIKYLSEERKSKVQIILQEEAMDYGILVDEDKMENVFINLIENAIKYSPEGSPVQVKIKRDNGFRIEMINPIQKMIDHPERLKKEFVKAEEWSAGAGIGLWIANEIISLHGGRLTLECKDMLFSVVVYIPFQQ
jgi:signal transduction histidine kinase